jgi:LemA protein
MPGLIIGAVVVVLLLIWWVSKRNGFVRLENKVEEGFATIDVYLKKRYDLIPNLVNTVKGYASHEKETLERVIAARNSAMNGGREDKQALENNLTGALKTVFALSESYPQLKADSHFLDLQKQLKAIEDDLSQARKYYNGVVKQYNTEILIFPKSIVAKSMKLAKKPYFELDSIEERKNVEVKF